MPLTARQAAALVVDKWGFVEPVEPTEQDGDDKKDEWVDELVETIHTALMHAYTEEVRPSVVIREAEALWALTRNNCKMLHAMKTACIGVYAKDGCRGPRECSEGSVRPAANFIDFDNFCNWHVASSPLRLWMTAYLVAVFQRLDDLGTTAKFLQTCAAEPLDEEEDGQTSSEEGEGESEEEESSEDEESAESEEAESDAEAAEAAADGRGGGKRRRA
jgi:hypothetical protein